MDNNVERNLDQSLMTYYGQQDIPETDERSARNEQTIAASQTATRTSNEMSFQGTRCNFQKNNDTQEDSEIVDVLREEIQAHLREGLPAMMFPHVEENPINEFDMERIFADSYPWLFPGGFGDITHLAKKNKGQLLHLGHENS